MQKISFHCCDCMTLLTVEQRGAGKTFQCPNCRTALIVPAPEAKPLPPPGPVLSAKPVKEPKPPQISDARSSLPRREDAFERPLLRRRSSVGLGTALIPVGLAIGVGVIIGAIILAAAMTHKSTEGFTRSSPDLRISQSGFSFQRNGNRTVFTVSYQITSGTLSPYDRILWKIRPVDADLLWIDFNRGELSVYYDAKQIANAGTLTREAEIRVLGPKADKLGRFESSFLISRNGRIAMDPVDRMSDVVLFSDNPSSPSENQPATPGNRASPDGPATETFVNLSNPRADSSGFRSLTTIHVDYEVQGGEGTFQFPGLYCKITSSLNSWSRSVYLNRRGTLNFDVVQSQLTSRDSGPWTVCIEKNEAAQRRVISNAVTVSDTSPPDPNPFGPPKGPNVPPNNPFPNRPNLPPNRPPFGPPGGMRPPFRREP
jgi:hypothetical protein